MGGYIFWPFGKYLSQTVVEGGTGTLEKQKQKDK